MTAGSRRVLMLDATVTGPTYVYNGIVIVHDCSYGGPTESFEDATVHKLQAPAVSSTATLRGGNQYPTTRTRRAVIPRKLDL